MNPPTAPTAPTDTPDPFADGEDLVVYLRILPADEPGAVRVRQFLKALGRRLKLKCLSIGPATPAAKKETGASPNRP